MAEIYSITVKPERALSEDDLTAFTRTQVSAANLIPGRGIEGDAKGGHHPNRQLNILSLEWVDGLQEMGYETDPGSFGEQLIIRGLNVDSLDPGVKLYIGEKAVIEITKARAGCERLEAAQGGLPVAGFGGYVGMLARVVSPGRIRRGDLVRQGEINIRH